MSDTRFRPAVRRNGRLLAYALALLLPASAHGVSSLDDSNYFSQIAKNGFALTVKGQFFQDDINKSGLFPYLQANVGSPANSYAWSMRLFGGNLYVGTVRNLHCTGPYEGISTADCPDLAAGELPGASWRAEIWRYAPSPLTVAEDFGLGGTWTRIYQSPYVSSILSLLGGIPRTTPRDIGYRAMTLCNAGDQVERMYVATFGIPGNILYHNAGGTSFSATSTSGTYTGLSNLLNGSYDLGYRALTCFKGRLWTSPIGTISDPDASAHPVVLMNPRPANGAAWQQVLDIRDESLVDAVTGGVLGDSDNGSIFQMAAIGNYLFLSVGNRVSGFEIWRGDGANCHEPWDAADTSCTIAWTKLIDNGAGRPDDQSTRNPGVDNAGATLGEFGNDLYIGAAESGYFALTAAELLRIPDAGNGGDQWQLLVGWPRMDLPTNTFLGTNFDCQSPGDITATSGFLADPDTDADDCLPASGYGPGMATQSGLPNAYRTGNTNYFWRFQEHEGTLFIGTLDVNTAGKVLRTEDGVVFKQVFPGPGANPANIGVRGLESTGFGLVVGTANPFFDIKDAEGNTLGGIEVFVGTTAFEDNNVDVPPIARAGANSYLVFDEDRDGSVDVNLLDVGSHVALRAGGSIVTREWFTGNQVANCAGASSPFGTGTPYATTAASRDLGAGVDILQHTFTLRVTDDLGNIGCDAVTVTASYNLPPTAVVTPSVPFGPDNSGRRVQLVDFDNSGQESYDVSGLCEDVDDDIVSCQWVVEDAGTTLSNQTTCSNPLGCGLTNTLSVQRRDLAEALAGGSSSPNMVLLATDKNGYTGEFRWDTEVNGVSDTPDVNNAPVCRSVNLKTAPNTPLAIDPTVVLADGHPICFDPDGNPLTYAIRTPNPTNGGAVADVGPPATVTYTPNAGFVGTGDFRFRALDASSNSDTVTVRVTVAAPDVTPPVALIGFPVNGTTYSSASNYASGCGTAAEDLCGTASDTAPGVVARVDVRIKNPSGQYWNGSAFQAAELWLNASGTTAWSYVLPWAGLAANTTYELSAQAFDDAGLPSSVESVSFTKAVPDTTKPTVAITFPSSSYYSASSFARGCSTTVADVCGTASDAGGLASAEVSIRNSSGRYWNGTSFAGTTQVWLAASLTGGAWNYGFTPPTTGSYTLSARSKDTAGNISNTVSRTFRRY